MGWVGGEEGKRDRREEGRKEESKAKMKLKENKLKKKINLLNFFLVLI